MKSFGLLAGAGAAAVLAAGILAAPVLLASGAVAQESANLDNQAATAAGAPDITPDPYQRSYKIYMYEKAAKSGPQRGEELFFYNCYFCHNPYTKAAPHLEGLYKFKTLYNGKAVTDDTVMTQVVDGSAGMPAFKYTLSKADLSDLISFLHNCCFDADNPPLNPQYRMK